MMCLQVLFRFGTHVVVFTQKNISRKIEEAPQSESCQLHGVLSWLSLYRYITNHILYMIFSLIYNSDQLLYVKCKCGVTNNVVVSCTDKYCLKTSSAVIEGRSLFQHVTVQHHPTHLQIYIYIYMYIYIYTHTSKHLHI